MGQQFVEPLGINSKILAGTNSTSVQPIFMYQGSPYVQSGNSLQPVEPAYRTKNNGKIVNAPLTNANWLPHGPKRNNAFNVSATNPLGKVNYSAGSWATSPGPSTTLSNANAAAILRKINAGTIGVPNVPLSNLGMKKVNNAPAIQISTLPQVSQAAILGTNILDKLKPITPKLQDFLKLRQSVFKKLFTSEVRNIPKNTSAVNTYVTKIQQCPAPRQFLKFLQALPATVGANNRKLFINTNINSIRNWNSILQKSGLPQDEFMFFRDVVTNKELMGAYNQTLMALPGSNKVNRQTREKQFASIWSIHALLSTGAAGAAYTYGVFTSPAAVAVGGMVLRSGLRIASGGVL